MTIVTKTTCPECGYVEFPVVHTNCGGKLVKEKGHWTCDACRIDMGKNDNKRDCWCNSCGHKFKYFVSEIQL
jgi:hypothetical protein